MTPHKFPTMGLDVKQHVVEAGYGAPPNKHILKSIVALFQDKGRARCKVQNGSGGTMGERFKQQKGSRNSPRKHSPDSMRKMRSSDPSSVTLSMAGL